MICTANDGCTEVPGVVKLDLVSPSDSEPFLSILHRIIPVEGLAGDLFPLRAMEKPDQIFVIRDDIITLFDD